MRECGAFIRLLPRLARGYLAEPVADRWAGDAQPLDPQLRLLCSPVLLALLYALWVRKRIRLWVGTWEGAGV